MELPQLAAWENFYVVVGSAGAALIGIQFVVVTLVSTMNPRPTAASISAFGTPTVVHLSTALVVSAIMSVPWTSLLPTSAALALCGFSGILYTAFTIRHARRQTHYKPVWDDWLWYTFLPCAAFTALACSALFIRTPRQLPMDIVAVSALSFLLIGIRNAWDSVTHLVTHPTPDDKK